METIHATVEISLTLEKKSPEEMQRKGHFSILSMWMYICVGSGADREMAVHLCMNVCVCVYIYMEI